MALHRLPASGTSAVTKGILNPAAAQMFTRHLVYDNLFSRLTPGSFARMSGLCREVREATIDFATRAYDIDRSLGHYFSDPVGFRKLMARTYLLISGSFALQFFDRTVFPGSDLDLYIHYDVYDSECERILEVGRWLEKEGYTYKPDPGQESTLDGEVQELEVVDAMLQRYGEGLAVADVFAFEKHVSNDLREEVVRKIQLVIPSSNHRSPLQTILNFHSTCVINVITHDAAYSLYPYATFELSSALVLTRDKSKRTKAALDKYASRGFRMLDPRSPSATFDAQEVAHFFVGLHRQVDDGHSWVIPFRNAAKTLPQGSPLENDDAHYNRGEDFQKNEQMRRVRGDRDHGKYGDDDYGEEYEDDEDEYESEEDEDDADQCDEDDDEDEDRDPIPECRWRLYGDALPLVDYVGARGQFGDEY
ncbi:hypothetical protein L226DRAFT_567445 [Lentinus tigrinus ALCF2SS1-7]|uniref:Uncharacterized protein n=1 Tax=Lentinus tigrinus ALCF2SS1-6 TaxID=1328759 RepID=A0A5C2SNF1_9APHY|nr:hypothetical protein L227DRAFT_606829 [Lentinus tigrinus ALCF2SS1-6]RPD79299.1 hypothetical protein L226DRAFT_567445 [Lentinus tigrinus ALCF2SS1-7]